MKSFLLAFSLLFSSFANLCFASVGVDNEQGTRIDPAAYAFTDELGAPVTLANYINGKKPTILAFIYFECPGTCTVLLNGLLEAMNPHIFLPGRDFELVIVSMNPKDSTSLAQKKKKSYLRLFDREDSEPGWHFLTGTEENIKSLTNRIGFHYEFDAASGQYNHPSTLFFFTPAGTLSSVISGLKFPGPEFRRALIDAASGKRGSFVERVGAICLSFLPNSDWLDRPSRYAILVFAGIALVALAFLFRNKLRKKS